MGSVGRARPAETFPTEGPLPAADLIGRREDVEAIAAKMGAGANTVLAAPRRTGKTSVCDAALQQLERQDEFYVVKVDLFKVDGIGALADKLITATLSNRPAWRQALARTGQAGRTLYDSIGVTIGIKLLGGPELEGVDLNVLPKLPNNPVAHLDYALELPQRIAAADEKRLVLLIDEFQDVHRIGEAWKLGWAEALKRKMRAVFQYSPDVSFLFAGSLEHMMRHLFGSPDEPFFQLGLFHQLQPITAEEWREGLTAKFAKDQTTISAQALDLVIEKGEGHPRATMLIAQQAHLGAIVAGSRHVDANVATLAYETALRMEASKHEAYIERARSVGKAASNRTTVSLLVAVADGARPYAGDRARSTQITRQLGALRNIGLIERDNASRWHIIDPLFAEYLRRERP